MQQTAEAAGSPKRPDWAIHGLEDDVRPRMFAAADRGEAFALATIVAADGGPRPVGAQMVVTSEESWGFLSGGCIEADVAMHARKAMHDGTPRRLRYGEGSPFIDIRLPCGGWIEVAIERVGPNDEALPALRMLLAARKPAMWLSDGEHRYCIDAEIERPDTAAPIARRYDPVLRLAVVGSDPFALAIAGLGRSLGWDTVLLSPFGPSGPAPFDLACDRRPLSVSLDALAPDRWTAIAVATHDLERDHEALVSALGSRTGYVGVLGSRRKLASRLAALKASGIPDEALGRLHAPIGLPIDAFSPWEVAVAVVGEIIERSRSMAVRGPHEPRGLNVAV